jgi:hypothetical protein
MPDGFLVASLPKGLVTPSVSSQETSMSTISRTRFGLMFVVYQVIASWAVIASVPTLTASAVNVLRLFGWRNYRSAYTWLISGNPYFPIHIVLGLLLGWLLARSLRDRSMLWVWLLPSILLGYAFVAIPTLTPSHIPFELQAGNGQSRLYHYFGWGCQFVNGCVDQSAFTRPFYASVAYSIGAWLALKTSMHFRCSRIQFWMLLGTGIVFLVATILDSVNWLKNGWNWMVFVHEATPGSMGLFLMLLAFSARLSIGTDDVFGTSLSAPTSHRSEDNCHLDA